jgi:hypothetical protein
METTPTIAKGNQSLSKRRVLVALLIAAGMAAIVIGAWRCIYYSPPEAGLLLFFIPPVFFFGAHRVWAGHSLSEPREQSAPAPPPKSPMSNNRLPPNVVERFVSRWFVRYPLAFAILACIWWIIATEQFHTIFPGIVFVGCALVIVAALTWELLVLALLAWIAYGMFGWLATLPVSVAIIFGALIIASAERNRR